MKLLVVTQNVDRTDPIMGFFTSWIDAFAARVESIIVIGQQVGEYQPPRNVVVESLGKEKKKKNDAQVWRAYYLFWKHRHNYDAVFVHMTPIWILIGAPLWILLRKRMYLWYEIKRGSWKLSLAKRFVRRIFAATEHGIPGSSKKLMVVGHGIDTGAFMDAGVRDPNLAVAIGRITEIKNYPVILKSFATLPEKTRLQIAGGTVTLVDTFEKQGLEVLIDDLGISGRVTMEWVAPDAVPDLLQRASLFMHASQGGLDKALLQAMSSGCPVVSTSIAAQDVLPLQCQATEDSIDEKAHALLGLPPEDRRALSLHLRSIVETKHSLPRCIDKIVNAMRHR